MLFTLPEAHKLRASIENWLLIEFSSRLRTLIATSHDDMQIELSKARIVY